MEQQNEQTRVKDMLVRLNNMYDKEKELVQNMKLLQAEYNQLQEDKDLLQTMIMHQSNKQARVQQFIKKR